MAWRQGREGQTPAADIGESTLRGAILERALRPGRSRTTPRRTPPRAGPASAPLVPNRAASPRPEPPQAWCVEVFDLIEWRRFEHVVEALFAQAGFETRTQPCGADGGVDIWLHSKNRGGAAVSIVQCKHWTVWKVGVKPVRELRGVMAAHGIARGQFVTTSRYSTEARAFARDNGIMLHDARSLLELIASRDARQQQDLLRVAFYGEYWKPTCASCGIKLVERESHDGGKPFWGCRHYPRCKTMMRRT
jgi:restriction system protein